ncbi:vWA domain-containing protein [Chondromyces crocatus]|nr:vWA domain-containing protein [Chondromyces crocatus]
MKRITTASSLTTRQLALGLLFSTAAAIGVACGSSGGDATSDGGSEGQGAGNSTSSATGDGGAGGFIIDPTSGSGASSGTGFTECATSSDAATLVPLNMIIMFDRSGSMQSNNKWNSSTAALRAFIQSPEASGLRVALRFFPGTGCTGSSCNVNVCAQPAVDAAPLTSESAPTDAQEQLLISAITSETPNGGDTPIFAALSGATLWAKNYVAANPTEKAVVILVTDGEPNGCNQNSNAIAGIAEEAFTSAGIYTYAVGLQGSAPNLMNLIADRGGTGQGIFIGAGANAEQELLLALQAIQGSQLACDFQMPQSNDGQMINPNQINVVYTSEGGNEQIIGQVSSESACGANGGWYYDNPQNPATITLCPTTCQTAQGDNSGGIRIIVGCDTTPA